ncbi:hypothetical protein ACQ4PT_060389 [Festuca glaucescens]
MGSKSNRREISRDMLREILVKLPAKDLARSCCVSRLWHSVASNPSFRNLHAMARDVSSDRTEALLISVNSEPGRSDEASVFIVSSGRAMCCVPIPSGYGLANVCNGFLCFVHGNGPEAPAVVCNPVTGEKVALPRAPPLLVGSKEETWTLFALGFSWPTKEHKLFRLSCKSYSSSSSNNRVGMDVYTLGDTSGWRRRSFPSLYRPTDVSTPVLLHDKLYVLTIGWKHKHKPDIPTRILVIDVATESSCTYCLPDYGTRPYDQPMEGVFELNGQLWFVAHLVTTPWIIRFWAMSPPPPGGKEPYWDLCYSFHREAFTFDRPWGCWLDDDEIMCYRMNDTLHRTCPRLSSNVQAAMAQDPYLAMGSLDIYGEISKLKARFHGIDHKSGTR